MIVLTLISTLNLAHAAQTAVLALAPHARRALVRVHEDGSVFIADCPVDDGPAGDLSFRTTQSRARCSTGAGRFADTAANLARFDDEVASTVRQILDDGDSFRPSRRRSIGGLMVGGLVSVGYYAALRVSIPATRAAHRLLLLGSAATGVGATAALSASAGSRARRIAELHAAALAMMTSAPGQNPAPPLLIFKHQDVYARIRAILFASLERVAATTGAPR